MFKFLIIPILLMQIYYLIKFYYIKNHDKVLFNYCQLRRDIMTKLRKDGLILNDNDFRVLTELTNYVDHIIHYYKLHKKHTFRLKNFLEFLKKSQNTVKKVNRLNNTNNEEVKTFIDKAGYYTIFGIVRHTPFFFSQVMLHILVFFSKILIHRVNVKSTTLVKMATYALWLDKEVKEYGVKLRLA